MASIIRGSDNFDSFESSGIGINQTWQDVLASRSAGVTYTNSTGKPIFISIEIRQPSSSNVACKITVDSVIANFFSINTTSNSPYLSAVAIVPNGSTYIIDSLIGGNTITRWSELR